MIISLHLGRSLWRCVALPVAMGLHGLDGRILGLAVCALVDLSTSSLVKPPISIQTKTQTTLLTFVLLLSMDFHKMLSKFLITYQIDNKGANWFFFHLKKTCIHWWLHKIVVKNTFSSWSMNGKAGKFLSLELAPYIPKYKLSLKYWNYFIKMIKFQINTCIGPLILQ